MAKIYRSVVESSQAKEEAMTTRPAITAIVYPDSDGMPLPDGEFQTPLYVGVVGTLRTFFRNVPGSRVNGDNFLYYVEGNPRLSVAPDCYVALGLTDDAIESIVRHNTYLMWEVGKAPDFVLEIGSPSTWRKDLDEKRDIYARMGVTEYWRYDSTGGDFYGEPLVGERLADGQYERMEMIHESDGRTWSHSDVLNLDLWWQDGDLRFWDPVERQWLLTHEEEQEGRLAEKSRAELAEARVARLEAELRRLRGQ